MTKYMNFRQKKEIKGGGRKFYLFLMGVFNN
jgi:hypothetical protein